MDELKEESCSTESQKCCTKGIVTIIICSLICFFLGYYFGNKSSSNINRVVGSGINRPFVPNIPKLSNIPKQRIQRPQVRPNTPKPIPQQIKPMIKQQPQKIQSSNTQVKQQAKPMAKEVNTKK